MEHLLEVCVDTAEGLAAAIAGGADRIELCSALSLGGLTPSVGLMILAAKAPIPVFAMIRPRPGDFVFSAVELETMQQDIAAAQSAGLAGVVLGASNTDHTLNTNILTDLMSSVEGLGTTLHRAIDLTPDMKDAVEEAVELGFDRILSSGGQPTAFDGREMLYKMHLWAGGRIGIMAGSGVTEKSALKILQTAPLLELHASCSESVTTPLSKAVEFGFSSETIKVTSAQKVAALKKAIQP